MKGRRNCNLPLTVTDCHTHVRSFAMDSSKRPDLKRKLVVVGDGLSVSLSTRDRALIVWDAKVAVERLVC